LRTTTCTGPVEMCASSAPGRPQCQVEVILAGYRVVDAEGHVDVGRRVGLAPGVRAEQVGQANRLVLEDRAGVARGPPGLVDASYGATAGDPGSWQAEVGDLDRVRWWDFRRAQNLSAAMYRCPFCDGPLPALSEHMLVVPEGDGARRRHAHVECVAVAREASRLPTRDE
jgi:hypothetical protein